MHIEPGHSLIQTVEGIVSRFPTREAGMQTTGRN